MATTAKTSDIKLPDLVTMLEAGVHFGHDRSKKNPHMDPHVYMLRNRMAIIDLEQTMDALSKATRFLYDLAKQDENKEILYVGTKRQSRAIIQRHAESISMPYVTQRWLGGTLTNFSTVLKSIEKLDELKKQEESGATEAMTKKEKTVHRKEIERLESVLEGIKTLRKVPAALIVAGIYDEKLAVKEARRVGIPVIGIADTNSNPSSVDYPIPANDDAIRAIDLIISTLTDTIKTARKL